jgi:hypothetical protein
MTLRPEKDITKILLSTSSYLVGEYEEENFLLSIALNRKSRQYKAHDPEYFILAVKTESHDLKDYSPFGDALCIYLSILFGKRFDNHGLVEGMGIFWLPNCFRRSKFDPPRRSDFDPLFKLTNHLVNKAHVSLPSPKTLSVHVQDHCVVGNPI